jgi:hypothetical protein
LSERRRIHGRRKRTKRKPKTPTTRSDPTTLPTITTGFKLDTGSSDEATETEQEELGKDEANGLTHEAVSVGHVGSGVGVTHGTVSVGYIAERRERKNIRIEEDKVDRGR